MTPEKIEQAKKLRLEGLSPKEIASLMGLKLNTVYKYTANLNVQPCHPLYKTKNIDHQYFSEQNIANDISRLVLVGFIAADGCISKKSPKKSPNGQNTLIIRLCHKDSQVLNIFNELISNNTRTVSKSKLSQAIDFPSNQLCQDLSRFGIVSRKTATFTWPQNLSLKESQRFLLGYFYGDGCYHKYKKPCREVINFVSTTNFAIEMRKFLISNKIIDHCVVSQLKRNKNYSQTVFQGKHARRLIDWMFSDLSIALLPRKHPFGF